MSTQITDAMVNQYKGTLDHMFQQESSGLRGTVRERSLTGNADFWDFLGKTTATELTTRHSDTPQADTPHNRRMCTLKEFVANDYVDKADIIRILIDPKSEYAVSQSMCLARSWDSQVIAAFYADAKTGVAGATTLTFANDWPVARSATEGDPDYSAAALTVANLLSIKGMFDKYDVPPTGRHIVLPPAAINQLLATTQVSSADYNTVKALAMGNLDTFAGFKFHMSNLLPLAASTDYYGFAYHEKAMGVSMGMEIEKRVTELPTKNYSWQIWSMLSVGAARLQGAGVIRVRVDISL